MDIALTVLTLVENGRQEIPREREIVLHCSCPNEAGSARLALLLRRQGFAGARPLLGGIDAWRERNYPLAQRGLPISNVPAATARETFA